MQASNAFQDASNPKDRPFVVWGQVQVDAEFVILKKGSGKIPFDPAQHGPDERVTLLTFVLAPLPDSGLSKVITREIIAQSGEWAKIVWPSARACGIAYAGDLNERYVKATMVKTGRKWTGSDGVEREASTFRFDAVFPDYAACDADCKANRPKPADWGSDEDLGLVAPGKAVNGSKPHANGAAPAADNAERQTALAFLQALVTQYATQTDVLQQQIASTPLLAKYFTLQSPEVQTLLAAA